MIYISPEHRLDSATVREENNTCHIGDVYVIKPARRSSGERAIIFV